MRERAARVHGFRDAILDHAEELIDALVREGGLRGMCQQRHVNVDRFAPRRELWWYPYTAGRYGFLLKAMRFLFRARPAA